MNKLLDARSTVKHAKQTTIPKNILANWCRSVKQVIFHKKRIDISLGEVFLNVVDGPNFGAIFIIVENGIVENTAT